MSAQCAALIQTPLNDFVLYAEQSEYQSRVASYFHAKQQTITPACIIQPRSSQDVSLAVKTLTGMNTSQPCKFAIRGGGHTPFAGASNIQDGVTIDLQYMKSVEYDVETASPKSALVRHGTVFSPRSNHSESLQQVADHLQSE